MYDLKKIMKRAWEIKRENVKNIFSICLKMAWEEVKAAAKEVKTRFMIKDWFMSKNLDNLTTTHCVCYQTFAKEDVIKETEKAVFVNLGMMTRGGHDTNYTKKVWVPKSVIEEYAI